MSRRALRQTRLTVLMGSMAVVVVTALGFGVRHELLESWYLSRLESKDAAVRGIAAERLGRLGSLRAFPYFAEAARKIGLYWLHSDARFATDCSMNAQQDAWRAVIRNALERIAEKNGVKLIPYLIHETEDGQSAIRAWAVDRLGRFGDRASGAIPVLRKLQADNQLGSVASKALAEIGAPLSDSCS